ncbi:MAG: DUF368 domain-containing protein [Clostridiales bacterium]|nr:DUF368 domain-containing protein [Clostridiales bacterium]
MKKIGNWLMQVLRGIVIGLANVIPGVSGGTMMVSMGIYDTIIWSINHLFKQFRKCFITRLPYLAGMANAILAGAIGLKAAFARFPLPTNALFIGLILGSLPFILHEMKGTRTGWQGALLFLLFFGLVVLQKVMEGETSTEIVLSFGEVIKLFLLGVIASATMVVPGVSGSMMLKTLGYYEPIVTGAIPDLLHGLTGGDWSMVLHNVGILLPFGLGIIAGFFGIARLIAFLFRHWKGWTYCGILGMVAASPVVILMNKSLYENISVLWIVEAVICFAIGVIIALLFGESTEKAPDAAAPEESGADRQK